MIPPVARWSRARRWRSALGIIGLAVGGGILTFHLVARHLDHVRETERAGWRLTEVLHSPYDLIQDDFFGADVALTDRHLVVLAPGQSDGRAPGAVHVFDRATRRPLHILRDPDPTDTHHFASAMAVDGARVAVGVVAEAPEHGRVDLFDLHSGALLRRIDQPTDRVSEGYGRWLALSGNHVAIGSRSTAGWGLGPDLLEIHDVTTGARLWTTALTAGPREWAGFANFRFERNALVTWESIRGRQNATDAMRVHHADTGELIEAFNLNRSTERTFGALSLALDDQRLVIGSIDYRTNATPASFSVRVYQRHAAPSPDQAPEPEGVIHPPELVPGESEFGGCIEVHDGVLYAVTQDEIGPLAEAWQWYLGWSWHGNQPIVHCFDLTSGDHIGRLSLRGTDHFFWPYGVPALAVDDDLVVVGLASRENHEPWSGAVLVFERTAEHTSEVSPLLADVPLHLPARLNSGSKAE